MRTARTLLGLALLTGLATSGWADTIYLKNGDVIRGRALDRDNHIVILKKLGSVRIPKVEIARIELDASPTDPETPATDSVLLKSGVEIAGSVEVSSDGLVVIIKNPYAEVRYPKEDVAQIRRAQAGNAHARSELEEIVSGLLSRLDAGGEEARAAREEIYALGMFAVPYLEMTRDQRSPDAKRVIEEILEVNRLREVLAPSITMQVQDIYGRLLSPERETRMACVQEIVLVDPEGSTPFLTYLAEKGLDPELQALSVAQLRRLGRNRTLLEMLQRSPSGPMRLAVALALGDNGIYAGVPMLIEALRLPEVEIRTLAVEKLRVWTGQFFGYFPADSEEKRAAAIGRWEAWWEKNGPGIVDRSLKATLEADRISEDEKKEGIRLWKMGDEAWTRLESLEAEGDNRDFEVEKVRYFFRKSLDSYPTFVNARLSLAVLLYTEIGDKDDAIRELRVVLDRYGVGLSPFVLRLVHYHLGRVHVLTGETRVAEADFQSAIKADPRFADAHVELGRLLFDRALRASDQTREARLGAFNKALAAFDEAVRVIGFQREELKDSATRVIVASRDRPFEGGMYKDSVQAAQRLLDEAEAQVQFDRGRVLSALQKNADALRAFRRASALRPDDDRFTQAVKAGEARIGRIESEEAVSTESEGAAAGEKKPPVRPEEAPEVSGPDAKPAGPSGSAESHEARRDELLMVAEQLQKEKKHREAILATGHALDLFPDDPRALWIRGVSLTRSGRLADGLLDLARAVHLDPAHIDAFGREFDTLSYGLDTSRLLEAIAESPQAESCDALFLRAVVLEASAGSEADAMARARTLLQAAVEQDANFAAAHLHLARVHARMGASPDALAALEQAFSTGYRGLERVEEDPDLAEVRNLPGYDALIRRLRGAEGDPVEEIPAQKKVG